MSTNQGKTAKRGRPAKNLETPKGMKIYQIIVIPPIKEIDQKFSPMEEFSSKEENSGFSKGESPALFYYIGSTSQSLNDKLSFQKYTAKRCVDNAPLHKMMRIPGYRFEITLIRDCIELSYLETKKREQALIDELVKDPFCLNKRKVSIRTNISG